MNALKCPWEKFYFSRARCTLSRGQFMILSIFLILSALVISQLFYYSEFAIALSISLLVLASLIMPYLMLGMISYGKTNLILRPDGNKNWSIHMGVKSSFCPKYASNLPRNFIKTGIKSILSDAIKHKLHGKILLSSHLLNEKDARNRLINELRDEFSEISAKEKLNSGTLGKLSSLMINAIITERNKKEGSKIPLTTPGKTHGVEIEM